VRCRDDRGGATPFVCDVRDGGCRRHTKVDNGDAFGPKTVDDGAGQLRA